MTERLIKKVFMAMPLSDCNNLPAVTSDFPDSFQSSLNSVDTELNTIVKSAHITNRQQAIVVKCMLTRHLGILNALYNLADNASGRNVRRKKSREKWKSVDKKNSLT